MTSSHVIHLPHWRDLVRRSGEHLLEATLIPCVLFYVVLGTVGLRWALVAALGWAYAAIARRLLRRKRMSGLLVLAAVLLTARTGIALATGSAFIYFLQPTLGTFLVAAIFLASVPLGRPLAERLAHDFCALPDALMKNARVKQFFLRISLLWALTYLINGSMTLYLLLTAELEQFLVLRYVVSLTMMVAGISISALWFFRSLRHEGIVLRWQRRGFIPAPAAAAA